MRRLLLALAYRFEVHLALTLGLLRWALRAVERRLVAVPGDTHALATQGHLLASRGDHVAAVPALQQLVHLQPDVAWSWFNLGFVLEQLGRHSDAEQAFVQATRLDPLLDRAWYGQALCQMAQQRWDEAAEALRRTTELQPMSPDGWYQLAHLHARRREAERVEQIILHLRSFEPRVAAQLARETGLASV